MSSESTQTWGWRTSTAALKLAAIAYVIPFVWIYNPALILDGTATQVAIALALACIAAVLLARGLAADASRRVAGIAQIAAALGISVLIGWLG